MPQKDRSYRDSAGRKLVLRSERSISEDTEGWMLRLQLFEALPLRKRSLELRTLRKSGEWSTTAIGFLQAQEELELLREHGVELDLPDLLRG